MALWIQALFAAALGVSGFAVILPSIIASVLSVLVLHHLVHKWCGSLAGLVAAFVMAMTPASVAVVRSNSPDSILISTLLLATWAFVRAVESGKWRHVLIGAVLIGIAFNVKMLQAYLILPALFALYFFSAAVTWRRKVIQLAVATAALLTVSLSWAAVVDMTPASQRPYVGSSITNSAIELALGYNGLSRLFSMSNNRPLAQNASNGPAGMSNPIAPGGVGENGETGALRLFSQPLVNEMGWLLPFGLLSIALLAVGNRSRLPLEKERRAIVLWGGWLVIGVIFASVAKLFHPYYLATLTPALAAMTGIGIARLWQTWQKCRPAAIVRTLVLVGLTLGFQIFTVNSYQISYGWQATVILAAAAAGVVVAIISLRRAAPRWRVFALSALVIAMFFTPAFWGMATAVNAPSNRMLPIAYSGTVRSSPGGPEGPSMQVPVMNNTAQGTASSDTSLIRYLR